MKDQASLNLLIVDSPIDSKALTGHLMLRATSDGLKVYDNTGVETPIGGEVDESRLLPDSGPDDSWMHHSESMDLVTPADMTSMQSADWTLTAENVQNNFVGKPWGLFDSGSYSFNTGGSGPSTCTWTRRDGTPTLIDRLKIYTSSPGNNNGDSYEFYGSQDGNNWTLLGSWSAKWNSDSVKDTETNLNVLTLEVSNSTKYLHYKFSANSPTLECLKGYGVTTKNEWKKFPVATTSAAGLMAAADKAKLDKFGESDGKLTYGGAEIGGGGISEITVGEGLSGTGTASNPLNLNIANYTSQSTISLSSSEGSVNLTGYNSVNLQETFGNKLTLAERGIVITTASGADVLLNEHASNSPSGFVILDSTGKLPAVDGSQLTNLPAGAVDLSAYTGGINLNSTNDSAVAIKFNSGNPTYNAELSMSPAGVTLSGYGDVSLEHTGGSYLRLTSGEATLSSNASLALSAGSRLTISASEGIYLGAAGLNTAGGLVKVGDDGKIPSSLYDAGTGGDTSALETRVTTLETTVGTLNTTVDEILADYGEGSGALVYRVVASATEPENPTEGMLWIKTE